AEADARRSLSTNLGAESGESGRATTTVAPASVGADAHADYEPTSGAREIGVRSVGQSTPERVVGATGPAESASCNPASRQDSKVCRHQRSSSYFGRLENLRIWESNVELV